ncbi:hypothetical protein HY634_02765 [Candidatus Uhrbacteria bacterium]|nr:hypothetical protein [Candidatus Uhrbacteria bacterium]
MRFGHIDHLMLFGGGTRLLACADLARERGFRVEVFSAPRLLTTVLDDASMTVAAALHARGVPTIEVEDLRALDLHSCVTPRTLGLSFGAPWIFRRADIDVFGGRLLNAHGACLPENRGGATFSWQILRGDRRGAFLFHLVDEGVDSGAIVMMETYEFPAECRTPAAYRAFYVAHEPTFLTRFLDRLRADGDFPLTPQNEARATYFPRLATAHHAYIDWSWRAEEIVRFIAAFDQPHDGAMSFHRGERVTLRNAEVSLHDGVFHPFMRGLVIRKHDSTLSIAATDGTIMVRQIHRLNGSDAYPQIRPGHRLVTPQATLDDALAYEAVYGVRGLRKEAAQVVVRAGERSSGVS